MIREIIRDVKVLRQPCAQIDVTVENGLYFSVLKPIEGLVKDLLDTAEHYAHYTSVLCANQIGYFGNAFVLKHDDEFIPMMNPSIRYKSGDRFRSKVTGVKYYKKITLEFWGMDGRHRAVQFTNRNSTLIQDALWLLGQI